MEKLTREYKNKKELWLSLLAASLITAIYASVMSWERMEAPARALFSHLLGILGFVLLVLTECAYSIRKSRPNASREALKPWLQFHNFTGLVGSFLVLLHGSWKIHGLAGAALILTIIIAASGVTGRYIHSWVSQALDNAQIGTPAGASKAANLRRASRLLSVWRVIHVTLGLSLFLTAFTHIGAALYYATLLR